jgi:hypothetical protein
MWAVSGLALSLFTAGFAWWRSSQAGRNYYAADVYGMTPAAHRRYAIICGAFAAVFLAALFIPLPTVPLLGACVLVAIFYFSSFARGFSDEP